MPSPVMHADGALEAALIKVGDVRARDAIRMLFIKRAVYHAPIPDIPGIPDPDCDPATVKRIIAEREALRDALDERDGDAVGLTLNSGPKPEPGARHDVTQDVTKWRDMVTNVTAERDTLRAAVTLRDGQLAQLHAEIRDLREHARKLAATSVQEAVLGRRPLSAAERKRLSRQRLEAKAGQEFEK